MLKLKRRKGQANWYIRGPLAGQRIHESTRTSSKEEAQQILQGRTRQILERFALGERATITFKEAAESYKGFTGRKRFVPALVSYFGPTTRLYEVRQAEADKAARKIYPKASNATLVRQCYTPLIAILRHAAKRDMCETPLIEKPRIEKKTVEPASEEWFDAVLPRCSPKLAGLLTFNAYTGARVSEALSLRWEHVDFVWKDGNLVEAWAHIGRDKNDKPYQVALAPDVVAALGNLPGKHETGQVFEYASRNSVYGPIKTACKRAGVEYKATHAAGRHVFASRGLAAGWTLLDLMHAGRWASIRVPSANYGHLAQNRIHDAVRNLPRRQVGPAPIGASPSQY